jgi:hypothetical protein
MSNFHWDDINVKVDDSCPIATSDISVNLKNRQKAIDTAGYGPLNPTKPNNEFWDAKAERWNVTADDARDQKCGNCAAFIQTKRMLDCIDKGLGNESGNSAWDVINAGDLGYCEAFDFKCASSRTCDTWIVGGPITEEKENNMEEKSLEDMYSELLAIEEKSLEDTYLELLAIEEKAGLMVPVRPDIEGLRLRKPKFEKRLRPRPPLPGPGPGGMGRGRYKAEEEYEPEEDMLYDEEYVGDDEDDKAMMRPGGAGSPRDASDRQRGQQFMNWASGRSPSGDNVHPTSVGNMDIGDSGRRSVANSRMTDLMRNRSWTNPSPRPGVGSRATATNTGPAKKPNIQPAPLPSQNLGPRKKPKDWGSDNNAQLISGGIPQKSAWDEEAYYEYEYDFDMKKLPMGDGGGKRPNPPSPKRNEENPNRKFQQFADHLNARDVVNPKARIATAAGRQAGLKKYVGDVVLGAAGSASGAPIGDNRGRAPKRGPSSLDRPQQQKPMAFNQAMRRQDKPSQGRLGQAMRRQDKPSQSLLGENFSKSYDQGYEYDEYDEYLYQKSYDQGYDEYDEYDEYLYQKSYDQGYDEYDEYEDYLYQKSYDQGYDEYDEYEDYIDFKGMTDEQAAGLRAAGNYFSGRNVGGSSFGSADTMASRGAVRRSAALQNFGSEGPKRGAPSKPRPTMSNTPNRGTRRTGSADSMARRNTPAKPSSSGGGGLFYGESMGSRWDRLTGKASDEEMYWDDEDEMAIPPDTDDKAANPGSPQAAGEREQFRQFGDHLEARDIADGPQRAAESAKRKAGLSKYVAGYSSAMGTAQTYGGNRSASKPRPIRGPGGSQGPIAPKNPVGGGRGLNPGNPGPNKRPNTGMSNKPNSPIRPTRDAAPRAPRPKMNTPRPGTNKPASSGGGKDNWYTIRNWNT